MTGRKISNLSPSVVALNVLRYFLHTPYEKYRSHFLPAVVVFGLFRRSTDGISVTFNVIDLAAPSFGGKNRSSKITTMGAHF